MTTNKRIIEQLLTTKESDTLTPNNISTVENSTEQQASNIHVNSWDNSHDLLQQQLNKLQTFDELPTDEEFAEQSARHSLTAILESSNQIKSNILIYIKENNIQSVAVSEHTESQSFIWEDSQYILSNKIHLQNIYQIILNFDDITVETNVIKSKDLCLLYYKN